jgi:hypothetical protein
MSAGSLSIRGGGKKDPLAASDNNSSKISNNYNKQIFSNVVQNTPTNNNPLMNHIPTNATHQNANQFIQNSNKFIQNN